MKGKAAAIALAAAFLAVSCSTTRVLQEGEYRYSRYDVEINGGEDLSVSEMGQYVRQKPNKYFIFGWNPFLNIYNWAGKSDGDFAHLMKKIGTPPVVFNSPMMESSIENMKNHLEYIGYYDSDVHAVTDTVRRLVKVRYIVNPGRRLKIDGIRYELPSDEGFRQDFMADSLSTLVHEGDYLSEKMLEAESARSASVLRNNGYYDFSKNNYFFIADTLSEPGRVILDYCVREYTRSESPAEAVPIRRYHFGNVNISHSSSVKFKEKVLRGLNTIKPGSVYNETDVNVTYNRLSALRVFNGVNIQMTPSDSAQVDCNITLSESRQQGFKANVEASTNSSGLLGWSPQLSFYHKNIFHGGEWLTLGFSGNFQRKLNYDVHSTEFGVNAGLSLPRFLGLPYSSFEGPNIPRTEFKTAYNYQNRPEYERSIVSFTYGYSGRTRNNRFIYQFYPLSANFVRLYNLDSEFAKVLDRNPYMRYTYQSHLDAGVGGVFYYTTNSDVVPKTSYHYLRTSLDLSGNLLSAFKPLMPRNELGQGLVFGSPFAQYIRAELIAGRTWRWGEDDRYALAGRLLAGAGYAYGNSTAMPFEKQFYAGGANSMRGWQVRTLGPGYMPVSKSFSIPSQTGDMKLEADLEYRFPLFWKIEGAVFAETGNVWRLHYGDENSALSSFRPESFYKSLAFDWGGGVRVDMNFILIRVDVGFKLYDPSLPEASRWISPSGWVKNNGYAIHFGVGYPF